VYACACECMCVYVCACMVSNKGYYNIVKRDGFADIACVCMCVDMCADVCIDVCVYDFQQRMLHHSNT